MWAKKILWNNVRGLVNNLPCLLHSPVYPNANTGCHVGVWRRVPPSSLTIWPASTFYSFHCRTLHKLFTTVTWQFILSYPWIYISECFVPGKTLKLSCLAKEEEEPACQIITSKQYGRFLSYRRFFSLYFNFLKSVYKLDRYKLLGITCYPSLYLYIVITFVCCCYSLIVWIYILSVFSLRRLGQG